MKMKKILPFVAVALISGCGMMPKLQGSSFDTYIQKHGTPRSYYTLNNGNILYIYKNLCSNRTNWEEYNVEVAPDNTIVSKNYIKTCPYTQNVNSNNQKSNSTDSNDVPASKKRSFCVLLSFEKTIMHFESFLSLPALPAS